MNRSDLLTSVTKLQDARSARVSSWDQNGGNRDYFVVLPGETALLADLEGPGAITHLWFTQACREVVGPNPQPIASKVQGTISNLSSQTADPDYYRKVVIRIYWDNQKEPSVIAPLGDFFCIGNSITGNFHSMPFTVSAVPAQRNKYGGDAALNCYLTMPFNKHARVELENQGDFPLTQYFYVDYELYRHDLPKDTLYFHAHWKRENPTEGWAPRSLQVNSYEAEVPNLDGKDNYVVLETEGAGNYIGLNLSVTKLQPHTDMFWQEWWGEGDDMIFIDGEKFPPSLHGTGTEDYLSQAWGMQQGNAYPFNGSIVHESDVPSNQVSYRWHLPDPVRFSKSIKVTIEHGHANHLSDDWASTAYWYQTLPSPKLSIQPVSERLPRRERMPEIKDNIPPPTNDPTKKTMIESADKRMKEALKDRKEWTEHCSRESQQWAKQNVENAKKVRARWLAGN